VQFTSFFIANTTADVAKLATIHAQHVFDWDEHRASQYWFVFRNTSGLFPPSLGLYGITGLTIFPNTSVVAANASMTPLFNAIAAAGFFGFTAVNTSNVNDAMTVTTDSSGDESIQGSRLIPADIYRNNATAIGAAYKTLLDMNATAYVTPVSRISTLLNDGPRCQHPGPSCCWR
jgi:hypothetical protein